MAINFPNPPSQMFKPQNPGRAQPVVVPMGPPAPWEQTPNPQDVFAKKAKAKYGANWMDLPELRFQEGEKDVCYDKYGDVIPCKMMGSFTPSQPRQNPHSAPRGY